VTSVPGSRDEALTDDSPKECWCFDHAPHQPHDWHGQATVFHCPGVFARVYAEEHDKTRAELAAAQDEVRQLRAQRKAALDALRWADVNKARAALVVTEEGDDHA
jgi:hypothetical protein